MQDELRKAQDAISRRPIFANHQKDRLSGVFGKGDDLYRKLEEYAAAQRTGIPVSAVSNEDLFARSTCEVRSSETVQYPDLVSLGGKIPENLARRSGLKARRPAIKVYTSAAKGIVFGFYREIPVLFKEDANRVHLFPGASSNKMKLLNAIGGLQADISNLPVLERPAIFFTDFTWTNFCHWLADWVVALKWVYSQTGLHPNSFQYVFHEKPRSYTLSVLEMLDIDRSNIIFPKEPASEFLFVANEVIATSLGSEDFRHSCYLGAEWAIAFLRDSFVKEQHAVHGPKRIIIDRPKRGLSITASAAARLNQNGFVSVRPETLPFQRQAALFSQAEAIIAPHGAGLTNIAFCSPGTKVLEVCNTTLGSHAYFTIAAHAGLNYSVAAFDDLNGNNNFPTLDTPPLVDDGLVDRWFSHVGI